MKAILISIKPKYVADILNGRKTIEIRKSMPKCDLPIDVYIYCTKDNKQRLYPVALLDKSNQVFKRAYREDKIDNRTNYLNGKVVAKFTLNKVEEIEHRLIERHYTETLGDKELLIKSCLTHDKLHDYLRTNNGYAWHIDNVIPFDKPKEIKEFYWYRKQWVDCGMDCPPYVDEVKHYLTKAPQSWCYVEI